METKPYFAFWCKYCKKVQHPDKWKYLGEVGDYYTTHTVCPECKRHITLRQKSAMAYIREQKEINNKLRKYR